MLRLVAVVPAVLVSFSALAAVPSSKKAPGPESYAQNVAQARKKLEAQELKSRKVLSALFELNNRIRRTVSEKSKLEAEKDGLQASAGELTGKIQLLDQETLRMKSRLAERLKAISRLGGASLARILLSASNASELDRNLKIMGLIAERDRDLIQGYVRIQKEVRQKREKLAARLAQLEKTETKLKNRESRLVGEQQMKGKILNGIRKQKLFAQKSMEELREKGAQLGDESLLDSLFRPSFADQKGKLEAPVAGRWITEDSEGGDSGVHLPLKGAFIESANVAPVKAIFSGRTAYVGDLDGWGPVAVVDHGDHYYSVYAGLAAMNLKAGDEIRKGQVLGLASRSEFQDRNGVYFEVRYFSEPTQPQQWVKGFAL